MIIWGKHGMSVIPVLLHSHESLLSAIATFYLIPSINLASKLAIYKLHKDVNMMLYILGPLLAIRLTPQCHAFT